MASNRRAGSTRPDAGDQPDDHPGPGRASASASPVPSGTSTWVGARRRPPRPAGATAPATRASTRSTGRALASLRARRARHRSSPRLVAHGQRLEVGTERERGAGQLGPAEHRDRVVGGEGEQRGEAVGGVVVAHQRLGVPRRVRRVGRRRAPRAQSHHSGGALGVVVEQAPARDDERGGIVVELAQAVGRLGDEEPVVAAVAGDGPESFERLHRAQRYRAPVDRVVPARTGAKARSSAGEEVGATGEQLGAAAHLQRAPRERVLGPQRCPRAGPRRWRGR